MVELFKIDKILEEVKLILILPYESNIGWAIS